MKKYSEIKTFVYSLVLIILTIGSIMLAEIMNNIQGGWGFDNALSEFRHFFLHYFFPIANFSLIYFIVPRDLSTKKVFILGILDFICCIIIAYFYTFFMEGKHTDIFPSPYAVFIIVSGIAGGAIKTFVLFRNSLIEGTELHRKHLESKTALVMLQAQLNPHFLFNSLNNIDILVEENPKTASDYLKKLSEILRYVLYETKETETELSKEIDQIKSYIELQKIRTDNPHYVNFNIKGELKDQKIAPMIFIPFVENAFKHCKNKTIENAIDIEFELNSTMVKMICNNYYEENQLEIIKNEGLGIETIKQRLNLLYPKNHELKIEKTQNWFNVRLSINLNDNN